MEFLLSPTGHNESYRFTGANLLDNIPAQGIPYLMAWTVKLTNKSAKQYQKLTKAFVTISIL